jgi:hypothetical protein
VRAQGWRELPDSLDPDRRRCPLLLERASEDGHPALGCAAYEARPFGCRTYFCGPAGGPLSRGEVLDLIRRLEAVDRALGGDGPHEIEIAVKHALVDLARSPRSGRRSGAARQDAKTRR